MRFLHLLLSRGFTDDALTVIRYETGECLDLIRGSLVNLSLD